MVILIISATREIMIKNDGSITVKTLYTLNTYICVANTIFLPYASQSFSALLIASSIVLRFVFFPFAAGCIWLVGTFTTCTLVANHVACWRGIPIPNII